MGKAKATLNAFKKKLNKKGIATITVDGEEVSFPIKVRNELAMRDIVNYAEIKLLSLIKPSGDGLMPTRAVKYDELPSNMKTLIMESKGFDIKQAPNTFLIIHNEKALEASASRRDFILNNVSIICHIDFDYIIDEETGKTYLDEINENLGTQLESGDYINIVTTLYEEGVLSTEVVHSIAVQAEAIRRGEDPKRTEQRFLARNLNMNEELWLESLDKIEKEQEALFEKEEEGEVQEPLFAEEEETPVSTTKTKGRKKVNESKEEK